MFHVKHFNKGSLSQHTDHNKATTRGYREKK